MIEYRCPKCKSECVIINASIEVDVNDREFVDDANMIVEDVIAENGDVICADCNHEFPIDDALTNEDDEDED